MLNYINTISCVKDARGVLDLCFIHFFIDTQTRQDPGTITHVLLLQGLVLCVACASKLKPNPLGRAFFTLDYVRLL